MLDQVCGGASATLGERMVFMLMDLPSKRRARDEGRSTCLRPFRPNGHGGGPSSPSSGSYHVHRDGITGSVQMPPKIENGIGTDAGKRLRLARIRYFQSHDFLWRIAFERRKM